jgi:hypothetical protein
VSGFWVVAVVGALFFACGILTGVLGVMALSAMRDHGAGGERRRKSGDYDLGQTPAIDWNRLANPDQDDDLPPPWPGRRG